MTAAAVVNGSNEGPRDAARGNQDMSSQQAQIAPFSGDDFGGENNDREAGDDQSPGNHIPQTTEDVIERSIEDLVNATQINVNGSCLNVPLFHPQELRIIGRCVNFLGDTLIDGQRVQFHYEGVVGMVTKDTVMLLHVRRFTSDDFIKYQEEVKAKHEKETRRQDLNGENKNALQSHESENIVASTIFCEENNNRHAENQSNEYGCSFLELDETAGNVDTSQHMPLVRKNHRTCTGSMGPIPFMTISRRCIRNVVFGRDSLATTYSIFQCPLKRLFDMQYLRMFVRRYLVHTGQGNNPRNISLRSFIQWRCNCKDVDNELLLSIAKEELTLLLKVERDMTKAAKRSNNGTRNIFRTYRDSGGIFRSTGVLLFTHIPIQTFCLAILEFILTVLMLSFLAYSFATAEVLVIYGYVKDYATPVTAAIIVSLIASSVTTLHSFRMRLPLKLNVYGIIRLLLVTAAIGLNTMVLVMVGEAVSFANMLSYVLHLAETSLELCGYYTIHKCRGFGAECLPTSISPICMSSTCPLNITRTCTQEMSSSFIRVFIPIVVFSMVLIALFIIDHFLHYRLVQVSRMLLPRF